MVVTTLPAVGQQVELRSGPRQLLERMWLAMITSSYSGLMTYEHDGQLVSYAVSNLADESGFLQDVQTLSGPQRRFTHRPELCDFDSLEDYAQKIVDDVDALSPHYNFYTRRDLRVAGREAKEILIMPLDQFRYGYSFSVDVESGLMLRAVTLESDRSILERLQFVQVNTEQVEDQESLFKPCEMNAQPNEQQQMPWQFTWLPDGFFEKSKRLVGQNAELVYSDGLSGFSIFIEPVEELRLPPATTNVGATSVLLNYYDVQGAIYRVTMVGEVPMMTLQRIAAELQYDGGSLDAD